MSNVSINVFNLRKEYMKNTKANRTAMSSILWLPWVLYRFILRRLERRCIIPLHKQAISIQIDMACFQLILSRISFSFCVSE